MAPVNVAASSASSKKNRKKTKSKSEEETPAKSNVTPPVSSIASDIKQVREQINQSLVSTGLHLFRMTSYCMLYVIPFFFLLSNHV